MNSKRRQMLVLGLLNLGVGLGGCAYDPPVRTRQYAEKVSTLLISGDKKQLVILGDQHHYVFAAPADIVSLSTSGLKARVIARIEPFKVALNGQTTGRYSLHLPTPLAASEIKDAQSMGFVLSTDGDWVLESHLTGRRYLNGTTLRAGRSHEPLPQSYTVTVEAEETADQQMAERLVTPVTMTSEGILLIYYVALAPVLIPIMYLSQEKRPN